MSKPMTAKQIQNALFWKLRASTDIMIPRFTPRDWWECDLWRLTKNGYVDEYEIKLTVADFKVDAQKEIRGGPRWVIGTGWTEDPAKNKHQMLATDEGGPNRFWFVMPEEVAAKVEIPPWAGLVLVQGESRIGWNGKEAPKRHKRKWDGDRTKLLQTVYHRYWNHEAKKEADVEPSCEVDPFSALSDFHREADAV